IVFTSQGTPFMFAGEEIFRDKKGVHNSYQSPDSINAIDWSLKAKNRDQMDYYKGLIALRKAHPAFRMTSAEQIAGHLEFDPIDSQKTPNLISYMLKDNANGDSWKDIKVIFNGGDEPRSVELPEGTWQAAVKDGKIDTEAGLGSFTGTVTVAPRTALILKR
ncbi:MAG: DUF3372 domain-containing protein, partial [Muribaculaceae bacterium]|nr:DUF3372 domain-containing protein [Muribaculaceae bacterium]